MFKSFLRPLLKPLISVSYCDDLNKSESVPSLVGLADADIENQKKKIKTPPQFENLKNILNQANVNSFDGLRVQVQKQVNLNTVVSHFYWIGSQVTGQPIYQYRLILPFDDKLVNVATDMDFNIEGELKTPLTNNLAGKASFMINEQQGNNLTLDLDYADENSSAQVQLTGSVHNSVSLAYMQALTPSLSLGGMGSLNLNKTSFHSAFGGIYDKDDTLVAAQYDKDLRLVYMRRVNPNRVHLISELLVSGDGKSQMSAGAEYMFKQSKLHMSLDSNMSVKSTLDATLAPGVSLQLAGEIQHGTGNSRFGVGLTMGG